jgi:hypothetical protein
VALVELKAIPPLIALLKRVMRDHANLEPDQRQVLAPLLHDAWVTLVNASVYQPARQVIHKWGGVELASAALENEPSLLGVALGMLQNISLYPQAQAEIMRCRFMELIPKFLGGQKDDAIRLKSLSILHHLTGHAEHAALLIRHNVAILLCQELVSRPNNVRCRYKALSCMVNLSAIQPDAAHFTQPALLKCLQLLRQIPEIESLVDHFLYNVSTVARQKTLLEHQANSEHSLKRGAPQNPARQTGNPYHLVHPLLVHSCHQVSADDYSIPRADGK